MGVVIPLATRFWAKVAPADERGCRLWTGARNHGGYGRILVDGKSQHATRVAWEMPHGPIPAGLCALHRCDEPRCVNVDHLFLGTRCDNNRDRAAKGRSARGERAWKTKLTVEQVLEIRARAARGEHHVSLARDFGVLRPAVDAVVNRTNWRWVGDE